MVASHHNVFRSPQLKLEESYSFTFNNTGTYTYIDPIYKEIMSGVIIVEE